MPTFSSSSVRLPVKPIVVSNPEHRHRYVPIKSLVGPFSFPIRDFRGSLMISNGKFGAFSEYSTDPNKATVAFNRKKLLDIMLHILERLKEDGPEAKLNLCITRVLLIVNENFDWVGADSTDSQGVNYPNWTRSRLDLSEAYERVASFEFFFEVASRGGYDINEENYRDLDYIMEDLISKNVDRRNKILQGGNARDDFPPPQKRQRVQDAAMCAINVRSAQYHFGTDSQDTAECYTSRQDVKRLMAVMFNEDMYGIRPSSNMRMAPCSFALHFCFGNTVAMGRLSENDPLNDLISPPHDERMDGACLDLKEALAFEIDPSDMSRTVFLNFMFPDIRQIFSDCARVIPNKDFQEAVDRLNFDPNVNVTKKSDFTSLKLMFLKSKLHIDRHTASLTTKDAKLNARQNWFKKVAPKFKTLFNSRETKIAASVRNIVNEWEIMVETIRSIPIEVLPQMRLGSLDGPQTFVAFLYNVAEEMSIFCNHSAFVHTVIDSRWACQKDPETHGPHHILVGDAGSGKSHCMKKAQEFLPEGSYRTSTYFSKLFWATNANEQGEENPDENLAQIAMFIDEMPASLLGCDSKEFGDKNQGESNDSVAMFKEMTTNTRLMYQRNVEKKKSDGTTTRVMENGAVSSEVLVYGCMNRAPINVNPAFWRRFTMRYVLQFARMDGITFEECKEEQSHLEPGLTHIRNVMRSNARIQVVVSYARYVGLIRDQPMAVWNTAVKTFESEVKKYIIVPNMSDRLQDCKKRLKLLTDMYAIAATYQSEGNDRVRIKTREQVEDVCRTAHFSFDEIVSLLPEVEARAIPTERMCLMALSSLEDICFPFIHGIILRAVLRRWKSTFVRGRCWPWPLSEEELNAMSNDDEDDEANNPFQQYLKLPEARHVSMKEKPEDVAKKIIFEGVVNIIRSESSCYKIQEPDILVKGAIQELFKRQTGETNATRHSIFAYVENADHTVSVQVSKYRVRNIDVDIADVVKRCLHKKSEKGLQLLMAPYREKRQTFDGPRYAPQTPMFVKVGEHETGCAIRPCTCHVERPPSTRRNQKKRSNLFASPAERSTTRRSAEDTTLTDASFLDHLEETCYLEATDEAVYAAYHPSAAKFYREEDLRTNRVLHRPTWPAI